MQVQRPQIALGAVVIRDGELLMVRRGKDPGKGLWTVPGGRLEKGEYLQDALVREVREETGLEIEVGQLLGIFEVIGDDHYVILDYLAEPVGKAKLRAGDDADEVAWMSLDKVHELECTPRFIETLTAWGVLTADE